MEKLLPATACSAETRDKLLELSSMLAHGLTSLKPKELTLSPREQEVYQLLKEGLTNPQIAETLHISLSTVKMEVSNVLKKKGVSSREVLKIKK